MWKEPPPHFAVIVFCWRCRFSCYFLRCFFFLSFIIIIFALMTMTNTRNSRITENHLSIAAAYTHYTQLLQLTQTQAVSLWEMGFVILWHYALRYVLWHLIWSNGIVYLLPLSFCHSADGFDSWAIVCQQCWWCWWLMLRMWHTSNVTPLFVNFAFTLAHLHR